MINWMQLIAEIFVNHFKNIYAELKEKNWNKLLCFAVGNDAHDSNH